MSLLDSIIDATASKLAGPVIVSQEHNLGNIKVAAKDIGRGVQAQIDSLKNGGSWDEREYGISRAEQIRRLESALTPEAQARELAEMKARAVRRAGLDTTGGKVAVMVAGKPAWHGLGVNVAAAVTSAEAIRLASMDWSVAKTQLVYPFGDKTLEAKGTFGLVRQDTGGILGVVGSRYQPIQNAQGFAFMDKVMAEHGARYHTAGSVHGGAKVWMQVELPRQSFEAAPGDEVQAFATFFNPHDGSGRAFCYPTTNRVVCNNTLRVANQGGKGKGIGLRHTGDIDSAIADAQDALGLAVQGFDEFKGQADVLVQTRVHNPHAYFGDVLDQVLEITEEKAKLGAAVLADADFLSGMVKTAEARLKAEAAYARAIEDRGQILADILDRHESARCGVGGIRGTAWSALNAVTEAVDHGRLGSPGRKVGTENERASRRFESVIGGDGDEIKQVALRSALALAN